MRITPFAVAAIFVIGAYACSPTLAPAQIWNAPPKAPEGTPPTNSPELQHWYMSLRNKDGSPCCGEGDAYPVEVLEEPSLNDKKMGVAVVTNPAPGDVVTADRTIITRPRITGPLEFKYYYSHVVHERFGMPLRHAIAFLRVINGQIVTVYCVVPLPPGS